MLMLGRTAERAELDHLLQSARQGLSGVLVLSGEAGIGKTTLLQYAEDAASDFRTVRVAGYESEQDLAFAAVHRLLLPFLERLDELPDRQRSAIETAFGLIDAPPPNRFLVGLAALSLLGDAAVARPLLCVIDDAQWVDDESIAVLAFAGRRLQAEGVVLLFGVRDLERLQLPLDGLPVLRVGGLPAPDAIELLRSALPGPVDEVVAERVVAQMQGSPLALIELGREMTAEQIAAGALMSEPLPIGSRLEAHFLGRVRALPAPTQMLLLIVSAEASGDRSLIAAAARSLGVAENAAEPAEADDLLTLHPAVQLRHPLVRAAVYNGASSAARRQVHAALAEAAGDAEDRDRRAWHLAASANAPDADVADELAAAGERALHRGGCAASAEFFARAAELSPDRTRRVERALAAAQRHLVAGFRVRARDVLSELVPEIDDPLQRAKAARLEGAIRYAVGETRQTVSILLDAGRGLRQYDVHASRDALLQALEAAKITGAFTAPGESEADVAAAAREMPLPPESAPTIGDLFLDAESALFLEGPAAAAPLLRRAIAAVDDNPSSDSDEMLRWLGAASWAAGALGDGESVRRLAERLEQAAREHGAVIPLSLGLTYLGFAALFEGSLIAARTHLAERAKLLNAIGRPPDVGALVMLAWAGDETQTRAEADAVRMRARETRHGWMLVFVDYALTVLELGLGHYAAALTTAKKNYRNDPFFNVAVFPDLIEAAVRSGDHASAREALDSFTSRHAINESPRVRGLVAGARALLADADDAEDLYVAAIDSLESEHGVVPRARAHLLYGEWLRRRKRRVDAREQLRTAYDMFSTIGAGAFAARAGRELAAAGERARRRVAPNVRDLTPQEAQIARMAAVGATNPEIAHKLFLSASTVDYHLRKVYRKLDLTSRRQLSRALTG